MSSNSDQLSAATRQLTIECPSGTSVPSAFISRGVGHSCTEASFFTIPDSRANATPNRTVRMYVGNATMASIHCHAGAVVTSISVMIPVAP